MAGKSSCLRLSKDMKGFSLRDFLPRKKRGAGKVRRPIARDALGCLSCLGNGLATVSRRPGMRLSRAVLAYRGRCDVDPDSFEDAADMLCGLSTLHGLAHLVFGK